MLYGDLGLRDRLLRAGIGAVLGAIAGGFLVLAWDMRSSLFWHQQRSFLVPGVLLGGIIGAILAFRRKWIA